MHWPNFHCETKFSDEIWNSFIFAFQFSPSDILFIYLAIFHCLLYETTVWYYQRANNELIIRAINRFDWFRALPIVNVDEKVYFFTKTLLNIIQDFILPQTITCDDRDPPWINKKIKKLMVEKNLAFKLYCCSNRNMFLLEKFLKSLIVLITHIYWRSKSVTVNCKVG